MRRLALLTAFAALALAPAAHASTAAVDGGVLRVIAAPGEANGISVGAADPNSGAYPVADGGSPLSPGAGCVRDETSGAISCASAGVTSVAIDSGDLDDTVTVNAPLPTTVRGGPGVDGLTFAPALAFGPLPGATLDGGEGRDSLMGGPGPDQLLSGPGDDYASGGPGDDAIDGGTGRDIVDGGDGNDRLQVRDKKTDAALCGNGRDSARAEVLDSLDYACERVDYGRAGSVGRLRPITGHGRFVRIPGQGGARIDRRILPDVLYLIRRYKVRVVAGYATSGHKPHLHLSWSHSRGRPRHPVRTVWVWAVR